MSNGQNTIGYRDQEILIGALVSYAQTKIDKSVSIIKGMVRMSIDEASSKIGKTVKDVKALPENDRDNYFAEVLKVFFEKMNLDLSQRRKMKYDALQIYERWKELKRLDMEIADPDYSKRVAQQSQTAKNENKAKFSAENIDDGKEDEELLNDLDTLDLDGL